MSFRELILCICLSSMGFCADAPPPLRIISETERCPEYGTLIHTQALLTGTKKIGFRAPTGWTFRADLVNGRLSFDAPNLMDSLIFTLVTLPTNVIAGATTAELSLPAKVQAQFPGCRLGETVTSASSCGPVQIVFFEYFDNAKRRTAGRMAFTRIQGCELLITLVSSGNVTIAQNEFTTFLNSLHIENVKAEDKTP